ncbi:MAG: hypothetical protein GY757_43225, partial [bacterium]|nr:hypothetical protein [bacterium]
FSNYTVKDGLSSNIVFGLCESRDGTVWIGSAKGINRSRNGKFLDFPVKLKPIMVLSVLEDTKRNLWFASYEGLYKFKGDTLRRFTTRDGLPDNVIQTIFLDSSDNLWSGTDGGVSVYKDGTFTNYTTGNGLPDNACLLILESKPQEMWFGTLKGLAYFNGKSIKTFTTQSHGLVSNNWNAGLKDSRGNLWLASTKGITTFALPPFRDNTVPPPIHITRVKVMDKEISLSKLHQLKYNENYIRFEFTGICYSAPESVEYKYRLQGVDKDWQQTPTRSIFYYLQPGDYRFQ